MKLFSRLPTIALTLIVGAMTLSTVQAQNVIVADDFEGADFSSDWDSTANATIMTTGAGSGADGTDAFTAIAPGGGNPSLGALIDGGVPDICVDFFVQVQAAPAGERQFAFNLGRQDFINTNSAGLNLRFDGEGWAAFQNIANGGATNSFVNIPGLTALTPGAWHRVKVTATGFGTVDAMYDIEVSAADETTFNSSATGLALFHGGDPTTENIMSFNFNARFGNNLGFNVDQVTATTLTELVPDFVLGDVNCDGVTDFLDIAPFIQLLVDGEFSEKADIDDSDEVDFLDIAPFIAILAAA